MPRWRRRSGISRQPVDDLLPAVQFILGSRSPVDLRVEQSFKPLPISAFDRIQNDANRRNLFGHLQSLSLRMWSLYWRSTLGQQKGVGGSIPPLAILRSLREADRLEGV